MSSLIIMVSKMCEDVIEVDVELLERALDGSGGDHIIKRQNLSPQNSHSGNHHEENDGMYEEDLMLDEKNEQNEEADIGGSGHIYEPLDDTTEINSQIIERDMPDLGNYVT